MAQRARDLGRRIRHERNLEHGVAHVLRTGRSEIVPEVTDLTWAARALGVEHPELLRELGARSYMCVPLQARGKILGAITLVRALPPRRYTDADLVLAEDFAGRSASAIENARLYEEAQE